MSLCTDFSTQKNMENYTNYCELKSSFRTDCYSNSYWAVLLRFFFSFSKIWCYRFKKLTLFLLEGFTSHFDYMRMRTKREAKRNNSKIHFSFVVTVKRVLVRYDYDDAWKQYIYTFKPSITHKIWIHNVMFFPQFLTI